MAQWAEMRACMLLLLAGSAFAEPLSNAKFALVPWRWPGAKNELYVLRTQTPPRQLSEALVKAGIDERAMALLLATPEGPRLAARYTHRLPTALRDVDARQKALLTMLAASVDGAQLTLHHARAAADTEQRRKIDQRILELERRFWLLVTHTLRPAQRAALKLLLPETHVHPPNGIGHLFLLPGLTASQATRSIALLTEFESDTAPDVAAAQRHRKKGEHGQALPYDRRVQDRYRLLFDDFREVLTEAQWIEVRGLMPFVTPEARKQGLPGIASMPGVRAEQRRRLETMRKELEALARKHNAEAHAQRQKLEKDVGPDSAMAMMTTMTQPAADAKTTAALAQAAHEAIVEILDPEQVVLWLLRP
ncbi:MAG: hypothetical protein AAGD14_00130 [Planctomycetota bacterium]